MSRAPLRRAAAAALAALLAGPSPLDAALAPTRESGYLGQLVTRILEQSHYRRRAVDDSVSLQALRQYVDSLDYNHMTLEAADVERLEAVYGSTLDDRIKQGDLQPAFEIFNKFLERLEARVELVRRLAAEEHDFKRDEWVALDRRESPWPRTQEEGVRLWRSFIKHEILLERLNKTPPAEQAKNVVVRYERQLRSLKEYEPYDILGLYLTAFAHAYDPHSDYMPAPQKENFDISMRLSLTGIGAVLRSEDGYAKVVSLVPGGPAGKDKRLKPNDRIEAVAQGEEPFQEVVGLKLDRVVGLIRGEKGTQVRLRVIPVDAVDPAIRTEISLIRDEIKLTDQEAKARITEVPLGGRKLKVGVLDLPSFYSDMQSGGRAKSTTRDLTRLIAHLKKEGVEGLVFDLRRNGGGSLTEAVSVTGLFVKDGPVVQVKDPTGSPRLHRDTDGEMVYDGPLIVLTSRASASASEIFAAALQDYGRAVIVGDKSTFGKGTVQHMIDLNQYLPSEFRDGKAGALKLTIQKFYRIAGGSTQNRGVLPDIHLPSVADAMESTESSLKNAEPYDEIQPAPFAPLGWVTPLLPDLRRASLERVGGSREFDYIRADLDRIEREMKEKKVSLNEERRRQERKEREDRDQRRKKERAGRPGSTLAWTDVTLQSLDGIAPEPAPEPSTATVAAADGDKKDGEPYEKTPPEPDAVLEEGIAILKDLIAHAGGGSAHALSESERKFLP